MFQHLKQPSSHGLGQSASLTISTNIARKTTDQKLISLISMFKFSLE